MEVNVSIACQKSPLSLSHTSTHLHHVYPKVMVKVNQTKNFWHMAISKFGIKKSKVKVMGQVKGQDYTVDPVSIQSFENTPEVNIVSSGRLSWQVLGVIEWVGRHFKNTCELLNLSVLKISMLYKNHIFQCTGKG